MPCFQCFIGIPTKFLRVYKVFAGGVIIAMC